MDDELVKTELMTQMKPFMLQVEESVKEKTGANSLIDFLVDQVTELLVDEKSNVPRERRENLKLLIGLFGEQLGIALKPKTNKIEDAKFEVIAPPELGPDSTS